MVNSAVGIGAASRTYYSFGSRDVFHSIHLLRDHFGRFTRLALDFIQLGTGHPEVADFAELGGVVVAERNGDRPIEFHGDVDEKRGVVDRPIGADKDERISRAANKRRNRVVRVEGTT